MVAVMPCQTPPTPLDDRPAAVNRAADQVKHVSFHPLAIRITTAPDGEPEQAMIEHARDELAHRKRRVGVRTYSWDTPQIGDATSKAWHSMLNGFSATLEPFLHASSSGGVCSASNTYCRESSPDRSGSSRSRSRSGSAADGRPRSSSRGRDDPTSPDYDPTFIPASRPRLSLKLPTIMRTPSRQADSALLSPASAGGACAFLCPRKSILRSCCPAASTPPLAGPTHPHAFPELARTASPPPPPYHEPTSPTASDVVPVLPCCAACEKAAVYGSEATRLGSYEEHWSKGARKARKEAEKREAARAEWRKAAEELGDRYRCPIQLLKKRASSSGGLSEGGAGEEEDDEDEDDEPTHPECPSYRLGEMVKRSGNIDELGDAHTLSSSTPPSHSTAPSDPPTRQGVPAGEAGTGSTTSTEDELADLSLASAAVPSEEPQVVTSEPPVVTSEPPPEPVRPTGRRRLSSISHKIATTLGGGLLSPPPGNVTGLRA
ncbi:hypothetical protein JCM3774_005016 [Rhodotorula dairenensis]